MKHVVLTGFKSSGKTTVGRALAERLGADFSDLDGEIEAIHAERTGRRLSFREIFRVGGAEVFRALEREAAEIVACRAATARRAIVLALGGGALLEPATREAVRRIGPVIYLKVPFAEILPRVRAGGFPAYVQGDDPEAELEAVFREREPQYEASSDVIVDLAGALPEEAAARIQQILREEEPRNGR